MSDQTELVERLNDEILDIMGEANFTELRSKFVELKERQEKYDDKKNSGVNELREKFAQLFEDEELVGGSVRVRDGSAYKNQSPSKADATAFRDAVRADERFGDEEVEIVDNTLGMKGNRLKKEIQNKARVLMDDERDFDAVTLRIKGGYRYLKLRRLDGGKNHKMQPLEDIDQKHVEELQKFIVYNEEKIELIEEMTSRVTEALGEVEENLEAVRNMELS